MDCNALSYYRRYYVSIEIVPVVYLENCSLHHLHSIRTSSLICSLSSHYLHSVSYIARTLFSNRFRSNRHSLHRPRPVPYRIDLWCTVERSSASGTFHSFAPHHYQISDASFSPNDDSSRRRLLAFYSHRVLVGLLVTTVEVHPNDLVFQVRLWRCSRTECRRSLLQTDSNRSRIWTALCLMPKHPL